MLGLQAKKKLQLQQQHHQHQHQHQHQRSSAVDAARRGLDQPAALHRGAGACRGCSVEPIVGTRYRALRSGYGRGIISFCSACMEGALGPVLHATHGPFKVLRQPLKPEELRRELREDEDGGDLFHTLLCGDETVLLRVLSHLAGRDLAALECTCHLFHAKASAVRHGQNLVEHAAKVAVSQRVMPCTPRPPRSWMHLLSQLTAQPMLVLRHLQWAPDELTNARPEEDPSFVGAVPEAVPDPDPDSDSEPDPELKEAEAELEPKPVGEVNRLTVLRMDRRCLRPLGHTVAALKDLAASSSERQSLVSWRGQRDLPEERDLPAEDFLQHFFRPRHQRDQLGRDVVRPRQQQQQEQQQLEMQIDVAQRQIRRRHAAQALWSGERSVAVAFTPHATFCPERLSALAHKGALSQQTPTQVQTIKMRNHVDAIAVCVTPTDPEEGATSSGSCRRASVWLHRVRCDNFSGSWASWLASAQSFADLSLIDDEGQCSLEIWPLTAPELLACEEEENGVRSAQARWGLRVHPPRREQRQPSAAAVPKSAVAERQQLEVVPMELLRHPGASTNVHHRTAAAAAIAAASGETKRLQLLAGVQTIVRSGDILSIPLPAPPSGPTGRRAALAPATVGDVDITATATGFGSRSSGDGEISYLLFEGRFVGTGFDPAIHWEGTDEEGGGCPTQQQAQQQAQCKSQLRDARNTTTKSVIDENTQRSNA